MFESFFSFQPPLNPFPTRRRRPANKGAGIFTSVPTMIPSAYATCFHNLRCLISNTVPGLIPNNFAMAGADNVLSRIWKGHCSMEVEGRGSGHVQSSDMGTKNVRIIPITHHGGILSLPKNPAMIALRTKTSMKVIFQLPAPITLPLPACLLVSIQVLCSVSHRLRFAASPSVRPSDYPRTMQGCIPHPSIYRLRIHIPSTPLPACPAPIPFPRTPGTLPVQLRGKGLSNYPPCMMGDALGK